MADQAPTELLKFERAADAFARYCEQPIATAPEALIGPASASAYFEAARLSAANKRKRLGLFIFAGLLIAAAIGLAVGPLPAIVAVLPALPAGWLIGRTMRHSYQTDEPRIETLIGEASPEQRDRILSLDEFCRRAGSGRFEVVERYPDGTQHRFSDDMLKCFVADGGKLLVLSSDPSDWLAIRRRPVPQGEILIDIKGSVASTLLTSETLIKMSDDAMFEAKFQWLLSRARGEGSEARSFRHLLNLVKAFRRPEIVAIGTLKEKEDVLEKEGFGRTVIHRMHSGNYESFQNFLKTLPLHELP